jgi:hypothetical protein
MPLPKIKYPISEFKIPSTGKKESFRPFLVKEEKLLLMAKSSEDPTDIFRSIKQIINNCCLNESFSIDKLTVFDLEYLFLKLRSISVGDVVEVSYRDNDDGEVYKFEIDLKSVGVEFPEGVDKVIPVTDSVGIVMKWPSASVFDDKEFLDSGDQAFYELVIRCIDKIYDDEDVFETSDYSHAEIVAFLDDCGLKTYEKIQEFMAKAPRVYHKIEYKNKNGKDRTIELTSLTDFFTLG